MGTDGLLPGPLSPFVWYWCLSYVNKCTGFISLLIPAFFSYWEKKKHKNPSKQQNWGVSTTRVEAPVKYQSFTSKIHSDTPLLRDIDWTLPTARGILRIHYIPLNCHKIKAVYWGDFLAFLARIQLEIAMLHHLNYIFKYGNGFNTLESPGTLELCRLDNIKL